MMTPEQFEMIKKKLSDNTTISWKLVYSDLYGRSDTLDVTTKFEAVSADESDSFTTGISGKRFGNCYDATDPKRCK